VGKILVSGMPILAYCVYHRIFYEFCILQSRIIGPISFRNRISCSFCARAKAAYKPFDMDGMWKKAKEEIARRA